MKNPGIQTDTTGTAATDNTKDSLSIFLEDIQSRKYEPYQTGLKFFDDLLGGGLLRGTLSIILAAPGAGKTALCAQVAEAIAEHGKPVVYLNLEMTDDQMLARAISGRATVKGSPTTAIQVLQGYKWNSEQRKTIEEVVEEYRGRVYPYLKYKPAGIDSSYTAIREYIFKLGEDAKKAGKEAPAIFLDYLHLITDTGDLQETIKRTLFMLKQYAAEYNTIALAISATNRTSNDGGKVSMSSGRDTSGIEYTGDFILGLNYYECELNSKDSEHVKPDDPIAMAKLQGKENRRMVLRVLKGRFTPPGRAAKLHFYAPGARFYGEDDFTPAGIEETPFGRFDGIE